MKCSDAQIVCQWLCAIVLLLTIKTSLGAVPSFVSPQPDGNTKVSIPETTGAGTQILTLEAIDSEDPTGASITYGLVSQDPLATDHFQMTGRVVETKGTFDYETGETTFVITFSATTVNGSVTANLTVEIDDVNDEYPQITGTFTAEINEELDVGTIIPIAFTATDADTDDVLKYSLSGDISYFDINSTTGDISVSQILDYDSATKTSFGLTVTVTDAVGHSISEPITVNLINIDDNEPVFINALASGTASKNIPETTVVGTSVFRVAAEDADGDAITYSLISQTPAEMFILDGTILRTSDKFDYETGLISFDLTLRATSNGQSNTATLTIIIEDVNDESPVINGTFTFDIDEELPAETLIGTDITTTDADLGDVLTYRISGDDLYFNIDENSGQLTTSQVLDYETVPKTVFVLTMSVRDEAGHMTSQLITINLRNLNDNLPVFVAPLPDGSSTKTIPETLLPGSTIYTAYVTDADTDADVTYAIDAQDPPGKFSLSGADIFTTESFDYESGQTSYTLSLSAVSQGNTTTAELKINIEDKNDELPTIAGPLTIDIDEEVAENAVIPVNFVVNDADEGDVLKYSITGDDTYFIIDRDSGEIRSSQLLDYDTMAKTTFNLLLTVRDAVGHFITETVTINLLPVNDNLPVFIFPDPSGASIKVVSESEGTGFVVCTIKAEDADKGSTVSYEMTDPTNMFTLIGTTLRTNAEFDYETGPSSYTLMFSAISSGDTATAVLTVNIQDENDNWPIISGSLNVEIDEEEPSGTLVPSAFNATDLDAGDVLRYSMSGDSAKYFSINRDSGEIRTAQVLDYETLTDKTLFLTITVTDEESHETEKTIAITVRNINDNPLMFVSPLQSGGSSRSIPETTVGGANIYTIAAEDADGDTIKYQLVSQEPSDTLMFTLDGVKVTTTEGGTFDFENGPRLFTLTFNASTDTEWVTASLKVHISDVNDETPELSGTFTVDLNEELPVGTVVPLGLSATDADAGDVLRYSLSGVDNDKFDIHYYDGVVTTNEVFDFDTATTKSFSINVIVTDKAGHTTTQAITINLIGINDNSPIFAPVIYYAGIVENTAEGVDVVKLSVTDVDGDNLTLSIVSGDNIADRKFQLIEKTIKTTASAIDYETLSAQNYEYTLSVTATDGKYTATGTVHIAVAGENEYDPVWATFNKEPTLAENALIGTTVLTISASDDDKGLDGTVKYSIDSISTSPSGQPTVGRFHLDEDTGILTTQSGSFDRDIATGGTEYYEIVVRAADQEGQGRFITTTIRVTLTNVNDNKPKFSETLTHVTIKETDTTGTIIQELQATDADDSSTITYSLSASSSASYSTYFAIQELNKLKLITPIDLDISNIGDTFHLVVLATDGTLSGTTTVVVTVTAVNEYAPIFSGPYSFDLSENTDIDTVILTVTASDADGGLDGQLTFSIDGGDPNGQFNLDPTTGVLKLAKNLDYETKVQHVLRVKATDGGTPSLYATANVTINVQDENDNFPTCDETTIVVTFPENKAAGFTIAQVTCNDLDTDTVSYSIKSGDETIFTIDSITGSITLKRPLDYDIGESSFSLIIEVNSGPDYLDVSVSITVTPVNEGPPMFNQPDVLVLAENTAVGTTMNSLRATDNDLAPHGIVKYVLQSVSNGGRNLFTISQSSGVIRLTGNLDYETLPSPQQYVLEVLAIDGGTPTALTGTGTLTVSVQDINDNTPECARSSYTLTIPENQAINYVLISDFGCSDADNGAVLQYSLDQKPSPHFRLADSNSSKQLVLDASLSFDVINSYSLVLTVSDSVYSTEVDIDIVVTDVNNGPPVFQQSQYTAHIPESANIGTSVITILATDPDAETSPYGKLVYTLTENPGMKFNIDPDEGQVTLVGKVDAEQTAEYSIVVQAAEQGGSNTATAACIITIDDVNDNVPTCSQYSFSVSLPESQTAVVPKVIYTLNCIDRDSSSVLQYSLASGDATLFGMNNESALLLLSPVDYESISTDSYEIVISVSDGTNTVQVSGVVTIRGENEFSPVFNPAAYQVSKAEDTVTGSTIVTVTATDSDRGETVSYSLESAVDEFKIEKNSGNIILVAELDRESSDSYELVVRATDGTNIATATVTVNVADVNDHTPTFNPTSYSITLPENTAVDHVVTTVSAIDQDDPAGPGQYGLLRYSLTDTFGVFKIDQNTGEITTTVQIDYEHATFYTLTVRAFDSNDGVGAKSSTAVVTVMVTGINEYEPVWAEFTPAGRSYTLPEDSQVGHELVTLSATDDDDGIHGVVFYTIDGITTSPLGRPTTGLFNLDQVSGKLTTTTNAFDRDLETGGVEFYDIDVKATDQGGLSARTTVRVSLTDINDNTPIFTEPVFNVEITEINTLGTSVKRLTASDADETSTLTYVLDTSSTPSSYETYFSLDGEQINLKAIVDLDPPTNAPSSYHLVVLATDGGTPELTGTTTVIVSVKAVNEETPTFTLGSYTVDDVAESIAVGDDIITLLADDNDFGPGGDVIYTIIGGDPDSQFSIHPSSGIVRVAKQLDYEKKIQYKLTIQARDKGTPAKSSSTTVTINILDESDSEPTCLETLIAVTLLETYKAGDQVAALSCTDDDAIDTVVYSITSGDTTVFQIDSNTGVVTLKRDLDWDEKGDDYLDLLISVNGGDDSIDVLVSVSVTAVNEFTPNFTANNVAVEISENASPGTSIAIMEAQDGDSIPHDIVRYTVSSVTNGGSNLFAITKETGAVRLVGDLDYETLNEPKEYVIKIFAIDGGSNPKTGTGTLTVSVLDENDNAAVCRQSAYTVTITEETGVGEEIISDFGCTDADAGTTLTYTLSQKPANHFRLETTPVARLLVNAPLNFDTNDFYTLTLSVGDGLHTTTIDIDIVITDVNNGGPTFEKPEYTATVSETASTGTSVITVSANDPDAATSPYGQLLYTLIENDENNFNIDPNTGKITVAGSLDAEETAKIVLVAKVAEVGGTNTATAVVNVTIKDVNDNKPECKKYSFSVSVPETTSGNLTTLNCVDRDITAVLQFSIAEGDTTLFRMNQNVLQLIKEIDYDTVSTDAFVVVIDVSDGTNIVQVSGLVTITAVNEHVPVFSEGVYRVSKAENIAQGVTIVKVTATDLDKDNAIQYTLASPITDEFSIDKSTGEIILLSELDRELKASYDLIVHASDGQHTANATVIITVTDVNDNTPTFQATSYSATVPEAESAGYVVISVSATDLDDPSVSTKYGEVRYSFINTNDAFEIDATSGNITTIKTLDYETTQVYTLFVQAIDSNGGSAAKSSTVAVTVKVGNVNEFAPVFNRNTYTQSVSEDTSVGTLIVQVSATDSDSGNDGRITYSMPAQTYFYLNSKTGEISLKSSLDYETANKTFAFEVVASDSSTSPKSSTCTVSISVSDVNDNEPRCQPVLYTASLPEDSAGGAFISQLTCSDSDSTVNADLSYVISSVNNSPPGATFSVNTQGRVSLSASTLDYETTKAYTILLEVSDNGVVSLSTTATIRLEVTDINEAAPVFDEPSYQHQIPENFISNMAISRVEATDSDTDDVITYTIEPSSDYFEIDKDSGDIFAISELDYEALGPSKSVEIIVHAKDNGMIPGSKSSSTTVTITVQDDNDGTPVFTQGVYYGAISENSTAETTVLTVAATDSDGDQLVYSFNATSQTFRIEQTGDIVLRDSGGIDYDNGPKSYKLIVFAKDQRSRTGSATVFIHVLNENEFDPAFDDFDRTVNVREDAKSDDTVIVISARDGDNGVDGEISYEILAGANGKFAIDKHTGQITVSGPLDREKETMFVLTISAYDSGIPSRSIEDTLTINIVDVNDVAPTCDRQLYSIALPENTNIEATVITLLCSDSDADPSGVNNAIGNYFITGGNTGETFEVTQFGEIKLKAALDREDLDSYSLTITVTDRGIPALTTTLTLAIQVTDINDNAPVFNQINYIFGMRENSTVGHIIGAVHATDKDISVAGLINYQIVAGNEKGKFGLDALSGEVTLVESVDFESVDRTFTLEVVAINPDESGQNDSSLVTIQIEDANDNKPNCSKSLYTTRIAENAIVGTTAIEVICDDIDTIGDRLQYSIVSGNDAAYFNIDAESGQIFVAKALDAEVNLNFLMNVEVKDGTYVTAVTIIIDILDFNEFSPIIAPVNTLHVSEDIAVGTTLYTLTTSDADISDTEFIYSIIAGNADKHFSVGVSSGEIQLKKALDREITATYVITFQVTDGTGNGARSSEIDVTFNIEDVNDNAPMCDETTYIVTLPENSPGQIIVTPVCTDADIIASPLLKYRFLSGNEGGIFAINEDTGQIDLIGDLDYEAASLHELTFEVNDQGNPSNLISTISLIVHVDPVNEFKPLFIETDTYDVSVDENTQVGSAVAQIKASDNDTGLNHGIVRFAISNGNSNKNFAINPVTGIITLIKTLDYESISDYSLVITARDSLGTVGALSSDFTIHINVNDINDNIPECSPPFVSKTLDETTAVGTPIATLQCSDQDASAQFSTLSYNLLSVNADISSSAINQFSISDTGILTLQSKFDYEQEKYYAILIKVSDNGPSVLVTTATVQLSVNDVNEHNPTFELAKYSANLKEKMPSGSIVLRVKASDNDMEDEIRYYFQPHSTQFEIDSRTGDIYLISEIDYDTMGKNKTVTLTVYAKDDGTNTGPKSSSTEVTINVLNENDGTPVFIPGVYTAVIAENLPNEYLVTTVTATDIDDINLNYVIESGNGNNIFRIDNVDGNGALFISDNTLLDYEVTKSYSLVVNAVDAGGLTGTTTVGIEVTGFNEYKPQLNSLSSTQSVPENSAIGHIVIDLAATDDDDGLDGEIYYAITSGGAGKFAIDPTSGLVTVAGTLDRETTNTYTVQITVGDKGVEAGPLSEVYTLRVSIVDQNDISPVCTSSYYSVSIKENATQGTIVAQLHCSDGDAEPPNNDISTYVIIAGNDNGVFAVSTTGQVSTAMNLDYEEKTYYELVIDVVDSGTPSLTTTTTLGITVIDENDNPPEFTENPYVFESPESTPIGTSVGRISATDLDKNSAGELVYTILSGNEDAIFRLDRITGVLYVVKVLDYDSDPKTYSLVVRATDRSADPKFDTSTIQFIIRDVNDQEPVCSDNLYRGTVAETAAVTTSVAKVVCDDSDTMDNVSYSIVDGNINTVFIINKNTGLINVATDNVLDKEALDTYDLIVQASDGTFVVNVTVVILVTDVNDEPPVFVPAGPYQVDLSEDSPVGHTLIDLEVFDRDIADTNFLFSIVSGNQDNKFKIGESNGILQLQREVDRDVLVSPLYALRIEVTDGVFTATTTVNVNVLDINDNYIVCDNRIYTTVIPENSIVGTTVFEPVCNDPDSTTDMHFAITSGNEESKFLIDEDDGKLKLQAALDYETTTMYSLTVTAADQGTPSLTTTLTMSVFVGAVNEYKPEIYGQFNVSINEDAPINQMVVGLYANDSDVGLNHADITFAIKNGNNQGLFNIHPTAGTVTLAGRLDYEKSTTHILTITAADMSPGDTNRKSAEEILTVHVLDVNDNYPIFDPQVYVVEIKEDTLVGTTIVKLTATDADSGLAGTAGLQYNIIGGNVGSAFTLNENAIILASDVDTETVSSYILVVRGSDQGNPVLSSNTVISIYVKATNEYDPTFSLRNDTRTFDESIDVGTVIYQLTASDNDTGIYAELRYYIRQGNTGDAFTLNLNNGRITVAKVLDFEEHPDPYILQLEVEDTHKSQAGVTRTGTMTLTIILNDENDEIPTFSQNTYTPSINENIAEGTRILTMTATDRDSGPNGEITYQIVAGNGLSHFKIDPLSGAITTENGSIIDYETRASYDLIVKAEDKGTPKQSSSCLVHVTVIDLNDETPEFEVSSFATTILEQKPIDTYLMTVVAVDKDSSRNNNNVFTYSFSEPSASFRLNQSSGEIKTSAILDRETVESYTLVVYAIDQGSNPNTGSTTINVQVIDINDNSPEITGLYDTAVSEDAITNTEVFSIIATDIDAGENSLLTYNITKGNIDGDFKIDPGTGYIQVKNRLDRERTEVYYLEVTVSDGGTPEKKAIRTATVTISDINDNNPIFDRTTYHFNVSEDVPVSTPVGRVTATDADTGINAALRYMIGSYIHGDSNHFKVDGASGVISTSGLLDREVADTYVFIYRAFDGGVNTLSGTATVSITIGDFDDHIPEFGDFFYTAHTLENQPVGTSILTVVTSDKDFGANAEINLSIDTKTTEGKRADEFITVDSTTSTLKVKKQINRETDTSFEFILIATDRGASPLTATATVSIIVDDVNDERPAFSPTYYNAEIAYNDDCAVTVTTLSATDKDYGVNAEFNYRFTLNPVPHLFQLDEKSGDITLLATASRDTKYILYAEATDSGTPPLTSNGVTIRIDTFTPNDHVITFNLGIDGETYLANEETFLRQLTTVFRLTYPTATAKRWCYDTEFSDVITTENRFKTHVHLYVVRNNETDTEASIEDIDKEFLTSQEAIAVVSADDAGTPSDKITGSAWEVFEILNTEKYFVEEVPDETPFFQSAAGVAIIVLIVLLLVAALAVGIIILMRKARKHNWFACLNHVEHGEEDQGDHVARKQYLTKTYEKKPLPPIGYYDKSDLPAPVVSLAMPSSTKKVPFQVQNQIYERPKDMHIYGDLIGFRPGSGVGSRLVKHPEKLRSGSTASSFELPPIKKLSPIVSRPPSFTPLRDVTLREITPRDNDESMRTIDDETTSLSTTKEFDGRAVDPVTGRVYEYSTRTHERRWVNESENGSHFKLKTEEK